MAKLYLKMLDSLTGQRNGDPAQGYSYPRYNPRLRNYQLVEEDEARELIARGIAEEVSEEEVNRWAPIPESKATAWVPEETATADEGDLETAAAVKRGPGRPRKVA